MERVTAPMISSRRGSVTSAGRGGGGGCRSLVRRLNFGLVFRAALFGAAMAGLRVGTDRAGWKGMMVLSRHAHAACARLKRSASWPGAGGGGRE
jgi:hypothetical protein